MAHGKYGSIEVGKPHEVFGLDFYSIPETSQLNTQILTIIDMFSSYVKFVPCRDRTAEQFVEALQKEVIFKTGVPLRIHTDDTREFRSGIANAENSAHNDNGAQSHRKCQSGTTTPFPWCVFANPG